MVCSKCKNKVNHDSQFCNFCGNNLHQENNKIKFMFTRGQKITIVSMLFVIILLLLVFFFDPGSLSTSGDSRTIMIYVVGSNLETDAKIVSEDLKAINPKKIDLNNTNILLYTGGTEKWHNFISNKDNGIYILKSNGFDKLESQKQLNLGDPSTLSKFLKYGYENYPADKYDLVLYNHGGAIDGAIYDDLSGDNLSLADMTTALKQSPFNEQNKLETVLFRTCLNGTLELSNIFSNYADYLIGSEELSYGSRMSNVFRFFNELTVKDNGKDYGIKFVEAYERQMEEIDPYNSVIHTYSVIDLSKIEKVNDELNKYISSIDVSKNYINISKIRANAYQYGNSSQDYDMIDLYQFVVDTKEYATSDNKGLLNAIEQAIVYNKTNGKDSHGLSIYFPFYGKKGMKNKYLSVYNKLDFLEEYKNFITEFHTLQNSQTAFVFEFSGNQVTTKETEQEISIQLTKEQIENYSTSKFIIFKQDKEHPNYYTPIYITDEVNLDSKGILSSNYKDKLVQIKNDDKGYEYILTTYQKEVRSALAILYDEDLDFTDDNYMTTANLYLSTNKKGNPEISNVKLISDNERIDGILLNIKDYEKYALWQYSYRILDGKGNVINTSEWESSPVVNGYGGKINELELKYASLDNKNNYYALFIINDISGNQSYSKLIKIGE